MIFRILVCCGLIFLSVTVLAQKAGNIWCFGHYAGLDFNTNPPTPFSGSQLNTDEGSSSIADPITGKLLFYTDGTYVWNKHHNLMPVSRNTRLNGHKSSTQSALIVPKPGSKDIFYVFTTSAQLGSYDGNTSMCYSIVDLRLDSGNGDIVSANNVLIDSTTEKIAGIAMCNGTEYWIVGHCWNCDTFYAFKLTSNGLSAPIKSKVGLAHKDAGTRSYEEAIGYMKFSSDGRKLGLVINQTMNAMQLFDFNMANGMVSNPITDFYANDTFKLQGGPYGCSFSPDNSKFYVSCTNDTGEICHIYQYDMLVADIISSRKIVATVLGEWVSALQNGPDGKMYISIAFPDRSTLDVIKNPNALGSACNFVANAQSIGNGLAAHGLPVIVESFLSPNDKKERTMELCAGDTLTMSSPFRKILSVYPSKYQLNADSSLFHFFPQENTKYTIIGTNECGFIDTLNVLVELVLPPTAEFAFNPVNPSLEDASITLVNRSINSISYNWYNNNTLVANTANYKFTNPGSGQACYTLIAYNKAGCTDTATHCVTVTETPNPVIFVPSAFTPNGDNKNDIIRVLGQVDVQNFSIYNRWGVRLFYGYDNKTGWDGTFHGTVCDVGTYFYMVIYTDPRGNTQTAKGNFVLIR